MDKLKQRIGRLEEQIGDLEFTQIYKLRDRVSKLEANAEVLIEIGPAPNLQRAPRRKQVLIKELILKLLNHLGLTIEFKPEKWKLAEKKQIGEH
ncbi:unnamed protein product [marine sediment metagenome]|uniref:Uncharacterized protein n=1 Tax=marine sediment metagenome TaxID=412755 RepID=X1LQP8_9ZZZZ